jgi:hypothetical protein
LTVVGYESQVGGDALAAVLNAGRELGDQDGVEVIFERG